MVRKRRRRRLTASSRFASVASASSSARNGEGDTPRPATGSSAMGSARSPTDTADTAWPPPRSSTVTANAARVSEWLLRADAAHATTRPAGGPGHDRLRLHRPARRSWPRFPAATPWLRAAAIVLLLAGASLAAAYIPARRASRLAPVDALRTD